MIRGELIKIRYWKEKFSNSFVIDIFESVLGKMMYVYYLF